MNEELLAKARAWSAQDPDSETKAELDSLIERVDQGDADALADLESRFIERLAFGTAGLRGELAAGPNRMNRVLVSQAAAGIGTFLLSRAAEGEQPSVVIGYDGRKNSAIFATDTAEILAGLGLRAILLPRLLPTPLVAFGVRHLNTSAGIMVTASHNPPNDNGYKVYLGDADEGSQIVSPVDAEIAEHITRVADTLTVPELARSTEYDIAPESVIDAYVEATAVVSRTPDAQPLVVYTAMHGVGWETLSAVLARAGYQRPITVGAQLYPDAAFPTVSFPNPEEPGAMDLAFQTAREARATLILANDPDADRLAVAIPDDSAEGFRRLTGNEIGALLGWRAAAQAAAALPEGEELSGTLACSIVSTPALSAIAAHYGLTFADTLTGFKWVSRAPGLIFGFEEALGYLVNPETIRDKDGISAALAFLELASDLASENLTIADKLQQLSETFGHFSSGQISIRVTDLSRISELMAQLRNNPPHAIGGIAVTRTEDLAEGTDELPASDVLRYSLEDGSRIMVRPSGTEPKLKVYLDSRSDSGDYSARKAAAEQSLYTLEAAMRELLV